MKKKTIIICSIIVVVVALFSGGIYYKHYKSVQEKIAIRQNKIDKINEKRSAISEDLSQYTTLRDDLTKDSGILSKTDTTIANLNKDAVNNSNLRRDDALSASPNTFMELVYVKAELADVKSVENNLSDYEKTFVEFSDIFSPILGEDALRSYNMDYKSYMANSRMAYSRWEEAAREIVNELTYATEGRFYNNSDDNTAGLYRDSNDADIKAHSDSINVTSDFSKIQKKVDEHINRDNASLDALVTQFSLL